MSDHVCVVILLALSVSLSSCIQELSECATYLSSRIDIKDAEYGQLSSQCFARSCRGSKQHVMICVIHRVKYLCLDWIKMREPKAR